MSVHEAYLRNGLSKYKYPDIAKRDILSAFQSYHDLRPTVDTFVFNDGSRNELLCLDGTIPVNYKGSIYNIPVCLWLIDTHPYNPPMVYVKPTSTMQIKPGRHVDSNGRVYLPYLHEWKHPHSDLLGLIQVLAVVFGEEPPVFARTAAGAGARPSYPGANISTPYPSASSNPAPGYNSAVAGSGYPSQQPAAGTASYPSQQPYAGGAYAATPLSSQAYPPQQYPGYPPAMQATTAATGTAAVSSSTNTGGGSVSLTDEQVRASLLSAVEDKMRRRLKETFAQAQAEMDALQRTHDDLQKGKNTLDDMIQRLEREQNEVENKITMLQEKNGEMKEVLGKLESREEVSIDDAVVPTAPIYRQILDSFAEEQATEDTIYYLQEGLKRGVIDLDVFLKQVRELSRRQYMMRVLIQKCRHKAGLPDSGMM